MSLTGGSKLGSYDIVSLVGKGGMGEVYRARDTKLNRDVAIKVLPAAFANDPNRMARFQREAHVLASLNHPHIATIYGLEESGQYRALVMELVEGSTLADRIHAEPIPEDEAFEIARQIAEALEYAHERGIIHRDLKPSNIKVTPDGSVKLLDFGLAKALEGDQTSGSVQDSPTITMESTRAGVILGTAAYMAPEQAKGRQVDRRADIWAFGVVLFEMLTGKQLYTGDTGAEVLASVMKDEPKLDGLSPKARYIIERCLRKDPRQRWQAIGDVRLAIDEPTLAESRPVPQPSRPLAWIALSALLFLALGVLTLLYFRRSPEQPRVLRLFVPPPEKSIFQGYNLPAVSPDGRRVAFVATQNGKDTLWVRELDSLESRPVVGAEGAYEPFWSPNSRFIAFFANGKLKRIDVNGGTPLLICTASSNALGGSWNNHDVIVFAPHQTSPLLRVAANGGNPTPVTVLDPALKEVAHSFPSFLPDGRHFLYSARSQDKDKSGVYLADLDSRTRNRILDWDSNVAFSAPNYLVFQQERTLMAQVFDVSKARVTGNAVAISDQARSYDDPVGNHFSLFSTSQNGVLSYIAGTSTSTVQLTWFERSGKITGTVGPPDVIEWPTVSPDGNTVAVDRLDAQTGFFDVWLYDVKRGTASRFTFNSRRNDRPIWSPDGSHILFSSTRDGVRNLYQKAIGSGTQDEPVHRSPEDKWPQGWSHDSRYVVELALGSKNNGELWVLPLSGDRKPFPIVQTGFTNLANLSPNGQWVAFQTDESGRSEIYVQTFPTPGAKYQISRDGGSVPVWSRDGKELFFVGADNNIMAAEVKTGDKVEASLPKALFRPGFGPDPWFDVSNDGHFLIPIPVEESSRALMTVVVNWPALLKQ